MACAIVPLHPGETSLDPRGQAVADRQEVEALKSLLDGTVGYLRRKAASVETPSVMNTLSALAEAIDRLARSHIAEALAQCDAIIAETEEA